MGICPGSVMIIPRSLGSLAIGLICSPACSCRCRLPALLAGSGRLQALAIL